jgi:uncharacterized protein YjiS (DUF1127 family)
MPPQQTKLTPETERDGLALYASIAAPDDALSKRDAPGPTAASTRSVLSLLKRCWLAHQERRQRQGLRSSLLDLSDRALMDIGLTRDEIDGIAPQRAIDRLRDGATYLWSRGVI